MNQKMGASYTLSVLIVLGITLLLHPGPTASRQPAKPSPPPTPVASRPEAAGQSAVGPPPSLVETRDVVPPSARPREVASTPIVRSRHATRPVPPTPARLVSASTIATLATPKPAPLSPPQPRGQFARTRLGETLADVARRVYGPGASVDALWRANRDILAAVDHPVEPGTLLRTP